MKSGARREVRFALWLLIASALVYASLRTFTDPDLWWHLKTGIDICQSGQLAATDPYSFLLSGHRWLNYDWLFDLVVGSVYLIYGWSGLVLLKSLVVLSTLALVYLFLGCPIFSGFSDNMKLDDFGKGIFLLISVLFMSVAANTVRPHMFSCLLMTVVLVIIRKAKEKPVCLWVLPPVFAVWVNLHAGFVAGLLTFLVWTLSETRLDLGQLRERHTGLCWLVILLSCAALCLNPYGWQLPQFVFAAVINPPPDISEMRPIELLHDMGPLWAIVIAAVVTSLWVSKRPKDPSLMIVWLAFALAPMIAVRHIQFFGIATCILVGEHLAYGWQIRRRADPDNTRGNWSAMDMIFVGLSMAISLALVGAGLRFFQPNRVSPYEPLPEKAMELLRRANAGGNMVVDFDWGGFAIWQLAPSVKVSWDGRREAYSRSATLVNTLFTGGIGPWDSVLSKYHCDIVLVKKSSPSFNLMKCRSGWKLAWQDDLSALFFPVGSSLGREVTRLAQTLLLPDAGSLRLQCLSRHR